MTTMTKIKNAVEAAKRGMTTTVRDDLGRYVATVQPADGGALVVSSAGVSRLSDAEYEIVQATVRRDEPAAAEAIAPCDKCGRALDSDEQQHGVIRHAEESGDGKVHDGGCDECCACVSPAGK